MKLEGYMLVKMLKTLNIYLFSTIKEDLLDYVGGGRIIAEYYTDGSKKMIKMPDGKLLRIA